MTDSPPEPNAPSEATTVVRDEITPSAGIPSRASRVLVAVAIFAAVLAADLWTKNWAWENLKSKPAIEVIEHVLYFKFGFNTGASFSFLNDVAWARGFFIGIGVAALWFAAWLVATLPREKVGGFVLVGLFSAGVAGNLHDRFVRIMRMPLDGEMIDRYGVVDFIQVYYDWGSKSYWPIFNVADMAMVTTAILMFLATIRQTRAESRAAARKSEKTA
jgi:signal peptidase II